MELVKQAMAQMRELENELNMVKAKMGEVEHKLNQATEALGLHRQEDSTTSQNDTDTPYSATAFSTPAVLTPASSAAPSVINSGARSMKVPLAARKSVRDDWEAKRPELEGTISKKLGVPWSCPIDYGTLWPYVDEGFAKENRGMLLTQYVEGFIWHLDFFIEKHGQLGVDELNRVAHTHTLIVAHIDNNDPAMPPNGTDIVDGVFRIIFKDGYLATNISSACEKINTAITKGDLALANAAPGGSTSALNFDDRSDIARNWDATLPALQAEFQTLLNAPVFTLSPNFEHNAAKLLAWEKAHPPDSISSRSNSGLREDWRGRMGEMTMAYFDGARSELEENGFANDELLQEGFKDVVDKNEISLRVVERLTTGQGTRNEMLFENGVAVIQTVPAHWTVDYCDPFESIVDLL